MSIFHLSAALNDTYAKNAARLALIVLADRAADDGYCWPGHEDTAARMNTTTRTTIAAVKQLEADGYLYIARGGERPGDTNKYIVLIGMAPTAVEASLLRHTGMTPTAARATVRELQDRARARKGENLSPIMALGVKDAPEQGKESSPWPAQGMKNAHPTGDKSSSLGVKNAHERGEDFSPKPSEEPPEEPSGGTVTPVHATASPSSVPVMDRQRAILTPTHLTDDELMREAIKTIRDEITQDPSLGTWTGRMGIRLTHLCRTHRKSPDDLMALWQDVKAQAEHPASWLGWLVKESAWQVPHPRRSSSAVFNQPARGPIPVETATLAQRRSLLDAANERERKQAQLAAWHAEHRGQPEGRSA